MAENIAGMYAGMVEFQSLFSWNLLLMLLSGMGEALLSWVSILVFVELALDACHAQTSLALVSWFQSLFSWNLLLMSKGNQTWHGEESFNPCFRGTCSWCYGFHFLSILPLVVSILVFVELALDAQKIREMLEEVEVSILVFVELALDDDISAGISLLYILFQSLFSWNLLLMIIWNSCAQKLMRVSILVFVELALDAPKTRDSSKPSIYVSILVFVELALDVRAKVESVGASMFQSLFSWNLLLMSDMSPLPCRGRGVSILVFVELALDAPKTGKNMKSPGGCFNPCFRGTCSWWTTFAEAFGELMKFQSLFSWNLLLMAGRLDYVLVGGILFQSLFSWNLLLMSEYGPPWHPSLGFNPCFRGTCSWCLSLAMGAVGGFLVSILVFVELALDERLFFVLFPVWHR